MQSVIYVREAPDGKTVAIFLWRRYGGADGDPYGLWLVMASDGRAGFFEYEPPVVRPNVREGPPRAFLRMVNPFDPLLDEPRAIFEEMAARLRTGLKNAFNRYDDRGFPSWEWLIQTTRETAREEQNVGAPSFC